jgi:hypothetical protein
LERIEAKAFRRLQLTSIVILRSTKSIEGSPFWQSTISIDPVSRSFVVDGQFLLSIDRKRLIRYFRVDQSVVIPRTVEIVCSSCFHSCTLLSSVTLERGFQLGQVHFLIRHCRRSSLREILKLWAEVL